MYLLRFLLSFAVFMFIMDKLSYSQVVEIFLGLVLAGITYYISGIIEDKYISS